MAGEREEEGERVGRVTAAADRKLGRRAFFFKGLGCRGCDGDISGVERSDQGL